MKRKFDQIEESRVQVSKMARLAIETTNITSGAVVNQIQEVSEGETNTKKYNNETAKVIFVEYTLNDLSALETKFEMCNAEPIKV